MRTVAVVPALDEAGNIGPLTAELVSVVDAVVVVDNGSSDGTGAEAAAAGAKVVDQPARGYGHACAAGSTAAIELGADVIVYIDGDRSSDPAELPDLLGPVEAGAYLLFDPSPANLTPVIFEPPIETLSRPPVFDVYGTTGDDPFAQGDLLVGRTVLQPDDPAVDPDTPSVKIDGFTIWLESDEQFASVNHQSDTELTAFLSQSIPQTELAELLATYLRTGELSIAPLVLLGQDLPVSTGGVVTVGTVNYVSLDNIGASADEAPDGIVSMSVESAPVDNLVLREWFNRTDPEPSALETTVVEHRGNRMTATVSFGNRLVLQYEVDGVPVQVSMTTADFATPPPLDDALALIGDLRRASDAEIEEMTERGRDLTAD